MPRRVQSTPVSASSTQHMWELLAGNYTALLPRHAPGRRIRTLICVPVAASGKRKTEDNLIFHYNFIQCSSEKLLFFCAAFLREYSYICSHYLLRFTFFYAMLSLGNFKVPLTLTVKKKRIVRFEGLPQFKRSDLGEQDVVGQSTPHT